MPRDVARIDGFAVNDGISIQRPAGQIAGLKPAILNQRLVHQQGELQVCAPPPVWLVNHTLAV